MSSIGFVDKFYTQITEAITAAATTVYIPDPDYKEILNLDEDYVYVMLRDAEDREIVIIDVSASSKAGGLTVARGQESTVAKVWPRGTTMVRALTAAIAGTFLQKAYYRSIGYDPTGAIAPAFAGEKLLQSTDNAASTRWWISQNATEKKWLPLTNTTDPGGVTGTKTAILSTIWNMEEWSGTGETTYDVSINEYNGVVQSPNTGTVAKNTTVYKAGSASAKFDLNGTQYAFMSGAGDANLAWGGHDLTIAYWVYTPATIDPNGEQYTIEMTVSDYPYSANQVTLQAVYLVGSGWYIIPYYMSPVNFTYGIAGSFTIGGWSHLAAVLDASAKNIYVYEDASLIYTLDISSFYTAFTGGAGMWVKSESTQVAPSGTDLYCYVDDVRYYNYALTAAEIAALPGF